MVPALLIAVAAMGRNHAIGRDNALPWRMPGDLARFRDLTMGTPMIMGRRTFEAIGRVLPGRTSIVVTRNGGGLPPEVLAAPDPRAALECARERAHAMRAGSISLIGGASLFETMMDDVDRLAMTLVDLSPEADTFFPAIDPAIWREVGRSSPMRHPEDEADCVFLDYERR